MWCLVGFGISVVSDSMLLYLCVVGSNIGVYLVFYGKLVCLWWCLVEYCVCVVHGNVLYLVKGWYICSVW